MTQAKTEGLWQNLSHSGVMFPAEYELRGLGIKVWGKKILLDALQEEMAWAWGLKKDTDYVKDSVFCKNFMKDFARTLGIRGIKITDVDFSNVFKRVDKEKAKKENMTKMAKKRLANKRKKTREESKQQYGVALVDGNTVELGNYAVEPPGIFMGRGKHPHRGRWKQGVQANDITLNLGTQSRIPEGDWGQIVCKPECAWIARWNDKLSGNIKYVWFADNSPMRQQRDAEKYDKARMLAKNINKVKIQMTQDLQGKNWKTATACYLIYKTAMRVGDEKDKDEADTVGATTLRKEHIEILDNAIKFDFLGKDSIRWCKTLGITSETDVAFKSNMEKLLKTSRSNTSQIFGKITSRDVNEYYSSLVPGVSAKVFRTYLATNAVKAYLEKLDISTMTQNEKLYHAKMANLEAAMLCNHRRAIPANFKQTLEKKKAAWRAAKATNCDAQETAVQKAKAMKTTNMKKKKARSIKLRKAKVTLKLKREKREEKIEKLGLNAKLTEKTKDYACGTSLRNYIDPRDYMGWMKSMEIDLKTVYTPILLKKFEWVVLDSFN